MLGSGISRVQIGGRKAASGVAAIDPKNKLEPILLLVFKPKLY